MVAVLVNDKKRTMCANLNAVKNYSTDHFKENIAQLEAAKFVYCSGFFISTNFDVLMATAQHAADNNKPLIFNAGHASMYQYYPDQMKQICPFIDIIIANEEEATDFAKWRGVEDFTMQNICNAMINHEKANASRGRIAIMTRTEKPVILATKAGETVILQEFPVEPVTEEKIVDNYGVGDAFTGGFISQLIQEKDLATCVKFGIYLAREVVQSTAF